MFFEYIWVLGAVVVLNLVMSFVILSKMLKQEQFHTSEAHANLKLINQSLNRLSDIAEKLEKAEIQAEPQVVEVTNQLQTPENDNGQSKEQRAVTMIRQGEDPRKIGRKLGMSKSELELLMASEKLGSSRFSNAEKSHV